MLTGLAAISKFSGYGVRTLNGWRARPPQKSDPLPCKLLDGQVTADEDALRSWLIRNGKTKAQQPKSAAEIKAANKATREAPKPGPKPSKTQENHLHLDDFDDDDRSSLEDLIDPDLYAAFPAPTGDIEDEIAHARQLRHRFGAIVGSWRLKSLANPKTARTYRDFAAELVRQIAVIGKLEGDLTKQRLRLGRLIDEASLMLVVERLANSVIARFEDLAGEMTNLAAQEVAKIAAEKSVDVSLDGDRFRKLALRIFDQARTAHGDEAVAIFRGVQTEQGERMGADEEEAL